jgi:hypothetical protein
MQRPFLKRGVWTNVSGERGCSNEITCPRPCLGWPQEDHAGIVAA